jgi:hypothetical protein
MKGFRPTGSFSSVRVFHSARASILASRKQLRYRKTDYAFFPGPMIMRLACQEPMQNCSLAAILCPLAQL